MDLLFFFGGRDYRMLKLCLQHLVCWQNVVGVCHVVLYSQRLSRPGSDGCCRFFGLFGHVLKVVLPDVSPVSVASIFRGLE